MPDYIYLFENRLTAEQQHALRQMREVAREAETILFLTGDAVRDLTNGQAVRKLEVSLHGNALKLKKIIHKLGGNVWGEDEDSRSLYLCFPGTVLVDVISTHRVEYPKPGKKVFHPASIHEDLRRRDFTVNAMAISLNEGSFGLLMDPLNGAADIEGRMLRLVSNYGFLEEPSLLIRATRYLARLGWELEPKTLTRYENAKGEGVIEYLSSQARREELEQIGHEEDGLKVLRALEAEGWMNALYPAWTEAKADEEKLNALHTLAAELLAEGVRADQSAAQMQLLTAKLSGREVASLKKSMLRPGFVEEWSSLDSFASKFAKVLLSKENATSSACFKLFRSYDPEAVLWLGFTSKDAAVQERYNRFLKVWPEARQRIPHALMQEMRITPELAEYSDLVQTLFLELIDGRLTTPEEMRAFLEPHSPPAPPPQVTIKRPRVKRGAEAKVKERSYEDEEEPENVPDEDLDDIGGDEEEIVLGLSIPKVDLEPDIADEGESLEDELDAAEHEPVLAPVKAVKGVKPDTTAAAAKVTAPKSAKAEKPQPAPKPAAKPAAPPAKGKPVAAPSKAKAPAVKKAAVKAKAKTPAKTKAKIPAKAKAKAPAKAKAKAPVKKPAKTSAVKSKPAKKKPAPAARSKMGKAAQGAKAKKPVAKKAARKPAKKR
jgi:tRNA nucleotidyltransferase/poly(A) polymerase